MDQPPFYVLLQTQHPTQLLHPASIHYHFADDPPLVLLPKPDEHFLVLSTDPITSTPTVQSLSSKYTVTGVKVTDAPGAKTNMYVIETVATEEANIPEDSMRDPRNSIATLAKFKQRNAILRRALEYSPPTNVQ